MYSVNVLMSTYNGQQYLREQIDSLLMQKGVKVQIIVRDDGSTDDTKKILDEYQSKGQLTWYTGENLRTAKSFMDIVRKVSDAPYYAFCDQDDVWKPEKLKRAIEKIREIEKDDLPVLYNSDYQLVDAQLNPLPESNHKSTTTFNAAILSSCTTGCTVVFNKALQKYLSEYTPKYQAMHDSWACRVCLAVGGKVIFDENYKSLLYRQHGNNVLGDHRTLGTRLKLIFKRISTKECSASRQAQEILDGYRQYMSEENIQIAEKVANYRKSIRNRFSLLFSKKIITPYRKYNRGIKVAILLGYL